MSKTSLIMNTELLEVYNSESFWYPTYRSPQTPPRLIKITIHMKTLFCFLHWRAVITTKKCYVMWTDPIPSSTWVILHNRERHKHTRVLKKQALKALMMLPAALFPMALPLPGETGGLFDACRVFCHILAHTASTHSWDSSSVRSSLFPSLHNHVLTHPKSQREMEWKEEGKNSPKRVVLLISTPQIYSFVSPVANHIHSREG